MKTMMFHTGTSEFYEEDGVTLKTEPGESLEDLLIKYDETKKHNLLIREQIKAEEAKYRDWDEWEEKDPIGFMQAGLFEENCDSVLDRMEWNIDLKILHINKQSK